MDTSFQGTTEGGKDEWLTPPNLIKKLGVFDLDPCSPINRPWDTAKKHYNILDDGLTSEWEGRVFCNPPYGKEAAKWLKKCSEHKNAIALIFARTETKMFFDYIWDKSYAVLFIKGRLKFYHVSGEQGGTAGAPSVLVAYNKKTAKILKRSNISGKLVYL